MHLSNGNAEAATAKKRSTEEKIRPTYGDSGPADGFEARLDEALNDALEDTFPASDPISSLRVR